jgi:hypothetical protein
MPDLYMTEPTKKRWRALKNYAYHLEELVEQRTKTLNDTIRVGEIKEKVSATLEKEKRLST